MPLATLTLFSQDLAGSSRQHRGISGFQDRGPHGLEKRRANRVTFLLELGDHGRDAPFARVILDRDPRGRDFIAKIDVLV
jgi:hypothetical protein